MRGRLSLPIAVAVTCILVCGGTAIPDASAQTASFLGLSSRSTAMGGALTALADDYTATFYNPAALSAALGSGQWLQTGFSALYIARDFEASDTRGTRVKDDDPIKALAFGLTVDLGRLGGLRDWTFGLAAYFPTEAVLDIDVPETSREYFFPVYNDVGKAMSLYAGLARRFGERLSLGIGTNIMLRLLDTDTHIVLFVDANELINNPDLINDLIDQGEITLGEAGSATATANRELVVNTALHAGLSYRITDMLTLGISFRDKIVADSTGYQYLYIKPVDENGNVVEDLAQSLPVIQVPLDIYAFFSPREYTIGLGGTYDRLTAELDLTYAQWSDYRGPHGETPPERFKDTWNPRLGIEYALSDRWRLRAGYVWRPTPVPAQTGVTNYLDADTHIFSAGCAYRVGRGSIDAHLQYHRMEDSTAHKDGDLPDVDYSGSLWNAGLTYTVRY